MVDDILKKDGLSLKKLEMLSYRSKLGINLKKNLHYIDKKDLFEELEFVNQWYDLCTELENVAIDYRIKSIQSAKLKYERYYPDHQMRSIYISKNMMIELVGFYEKVTKMG